MAETFNRQINIYVDSGQAQAAYDKLSVKQAKLTAEAQKYIDQGKRIPSELNKQLDSNAAAMDRAAKKASGELTPSLRDLQSAYRKASNELARMSEQDPGFDEKKKQVQQLAQSVDGYTKSLKGVTGGLSGMMENAKAFAVGGILGGIFTAGLSAIQAFVGNLLGYSAKLSDELADIQKTTGMTGQEVDSLNEKLKQIDTRTSLSELRQIAAVGGQFNVASQDMEGFVEAVDKINVALGDELVGGAENVATQLTKLRNIFTDVQSGAIDEDLLSIGNALNSLGNAGAATSDVVADFSNRIGGVGIPLGLTTGQVLGISATLQELGVSAERGGTAVSKILQKMTTDTEGFAAVAGMGVQEFTQLVNRDLFGAFQKVVEGSSKSGNSATALAGILKDAEFSGAGASEVFLKLSGNTSILADKVNLASSSLKSTSSIMQEFNAKNNNFAANLEKIQKAFSMAFESTALNFLGPLVDKIAGLVSVTKDEADSLEEVRRGLEINLIALKDSNISQQTRAQLIENINREYGKYLPQLLTEKMTIEDINKVQQESNRLLMTKILTISYEKEINKVLEEQKQSIEMVVAAEMELAKATAKSKDIGMTPYMVNAQKFMYQNLADVGNAAAAQTDARLKDVQEKFKRISMLMGISFEEIQKSMNKASGAGGNTATQSQATETVNSISDEVAKGRERLLEEIAKLQSESNLAMLSADEQEIQRVRDKFGKLLEEAKKYGIDLTQLLALQEAEISRIREKQAGTAADKSYLGSLEQAQQTNDQLRYMYRQMYADGLISLKEYNQQIALADVQLKNDKVGIALEWKDKSTKAAGDVVKFQKEANEADLEYYIAATDAKKKQREQDVKDEKDSLKSKEEAQRQYYDNLSGMISQYGGQATQIISGIFQIQSNLENGQLISDKKKNDKKKLDLKKRLDSELISEKQYNAEIEKLDQDYDRKQADIKRKQFERDKAAKAIEVVINTAAAIAKAAPNIPLMALAGAVGAVQLGVVLSQPVPEFEQGGIPIPGQSHSDGGNPVIDGKTGRPIANIERGEFIINEESTSKNLPLLQYINSSGKNRTLSAQDIPVFSSGRAISNIQFQRGGLFNGTTSGTAESASNFTGAGGSIAQLIPFFSEMLQEMKAFNEKELSVSYDEILKKKKTVDYIQSKTI